MKMKTTLSVLFATGLVSGAHAGYYKGNQVVDGEVIVKFKSQQALKSLNSLKSVNAVRDMNVAFAPMAVVKLAGKSDLETMLVNLNDMEGVEYAEPNYVLSIAGFQETILDKIANFESADPRAPRDPEFSKLWGLYNDGNNEPGGSGRQSVAGADINAFQAWDLTRGSNDVTIAVIDTGIDYSHPDLVDNMWVNSGEIAGNGIDDDGNGFIDDVYGYDFANNDGDPRDGHSHGTHCAGTIGATHNNSLGVAGVMANVKMMGIKFLTDSGSGSTDNAIKSIDYATKMNVDLMSNSWGGGGFSQALMDSISAANDAGILFVAAAGNSSTNNDSKPHYPSNYQVDNVISVAAHNSSDDLASFSCYGKRTVHVAAPGRNILSTVKNGGYEVYSGTSMATPHVSGVLGLLLAKEGRSDVKEIRERLMKTSVYVASYKNKTISEGRVNAYNLLAGIEPDRPAKPNPNAWQTARMRDVFETAHPYTNNHSQSYSISQQGAKYLRVKFEKIDTEAGYDFVIIKDANGTIVEKISGSHENYASEYVETDSLTIEFTTDRSQTRWGVLASEFEYQM